MPTDKQNLINELLVIKCKRNDSTAWDQLITTWQPRLFYYVRRLCDNESDAWDIIQDTWIKVAGSIKKLSNAECLPTWLYRIARNTAISHLRNQQARQSLQQHLEEQWQEQEDEMLNVDAIQPEDIHKALNNLPLPFREALTLYFIEDFSIQEIADVLGHPPGTVKSRLHYAKRALKQLLLGEEEAHV